MSATATVLSNVPGLFDHLNNPTPEQKTASKAKFQVVVADGFNRGDVYATEHPITPASTYEDFDETMHRASGLIAEALALVESTMPSSPTHLRAVLAGRAVASSALAAIITERLFPSEPK